MRGQFLPACDCCWVEPGKVYRLDPYRVCLGRVSLGRVETRKKNRKIETNRSSLRTRISTKAKIEHAQ